jgi:hypothetical protein
LVCKYLPSRFGASIWWWQEPFCFLRVMCCGEAFHRLGVQGVKVLILLGALFLPSVAPTSQQNFWFTELTLFASCICLWWSDKVFQVSCQAWCLLPPLKGIKLCSVCKGSSLRWPFSSWLTSTSTSTISICGSWRLAILAVKSHVVHVERPLTTKSWSPSRSQ